MLTKAIGSLKSEGVNGKPCISQLFELNFKNWEPITIYIVILKSHKYQTSVVNLQ